MFNKKNIYSKGFGLAKILLNFEQFSWVKVTPAKVIYVCTLYTWLGTFFVSYLWAYWKSIEMLVHRLKMCETSTYECTIGLTSLPMSSSIMLPMSCIFNQSADYFFVWHNLVDQARGDYEKFFHWWIDEKYELVMFNEDLNYKTKLIRRFFTVVQRRSTVKLQKTEITEEFLVSDSGSLQFRILEIKLLVKKIF